MSSHHEIEGQHGLDTLGFHNLNNAYWNLTTPALYEQVVRRREGLLAHLGPMVVRTGAFTGRSPNDKFIVREPESENLVWWGPVNRPSTTEQFNNIWHRLKACLHGNDIFVQ